MTLVNFSNLDFEQIKTTLREYLRANSDFTDYDYEGSNISAIIDVLAYNTYITSYNANMVANEVFIDSATLRENVVSLARNIGYLPRSRTAAQSSVSFYVDCNNITPVPSSITLKKGIVASSNGNGQFGSSTFSILDDITVPVFNNIANFDDIIIYEGVLLTTNYTINANNPNQRFVIPNRGVDTSLISVSIKSGANSTILTKFNRQDDLFDVKSDSKIYFLQEIEDEQYEIFFGDGIFGSKPGSGSYLDISYISSSGDAGNGQINFNFSGKISYTRNGTDYNITSGISGLNSGFSSSGGEEIEQIDSIKKYAPRIYASQNRAVTANDYESIIPAKIYPETEAISVFGGEELVPPQYGKVFISIKPRYGDFIPNLIKNKIKTKLKKYAVAGIVPEILDLKYLNVEVHSNIYYNANRAQSSAYISSLVQNNAAKYSESSEMNKYGARFKYSKFLKIIDDSHDSITSNITLVKIRRDLGVILNGFTEYTIGFGNPFIVQHEGGYNIKSSAFRIVGLNQDVYLSDVPNSDRNTGSIFFFTVPNENSTEPTIVVRNAGNINYNTGIITLNPINVTSTTKNRDGQPIIEIEASPLSNDVIGLQDLYLRFDITNSVFDVIADEVASGLDPSASNYVLSSSYPEGNLVRGVTTSTVVNASNSSINTGNPGGSY